MLFLLSMCLQNNYNPAHTVAAFRGTENQKPDGLRRGVLLASAAIRYTAEVNNQSGRTFLMYQDLIRNELNEATETLANFLADEANIHAIQRAAVLLADSFKAGGKVLSCGNGGSHCDAMHFAEELTGRYRENRPGYPAIAISDVSHLSCVSNDFGYEYVFSRYVESVGRTGDVLLGISTSGNSGNVIKAIEAARAQGMKVITLTGKDGGKMAGSADVEIRVPHFGYADRIQEIHIKVIHILIMLIEKEMVKS
jgi:D-sedoheptulose 7-phosphate isomerase